jgi:hypothetical protein
VPSSSLALAPEAAKAIVASSPVAIAPPLLNLSESLHPTFIPLLRLIGEKSRRSQANIRRQGEDDQVGADRRHRLLGTGLELEQDLACDPEYDVAGGALGTGNRGGAATERRGEVVDHRREGAEVIAAPSRGRQDEPAGRRGIGGCRPESDADRRGDALRPRRRRVEDSSEVALEPEP